MGSEDQFYYDDPEGDALSPETSHPDFVRLLKSEIYYTCLDDFSPFGNDDGADLLFKLEDLYRENKGSDNILVWLFELIDGFGFKYQSKGCSKILDEGSLLKIHEEDPYFIDCMDNTIIAAAFGQFKISGRINKDLKELALIALKRQTLLHGPDNDEENQERRESLSIMTNDLRKI
ncbi:MAG: hypothetical protein ACJ75J_03720 [Cytophagaceae bacterium]